MFLTSQTETMSQQPFVMVAATLHSISPKFTVSIAVGLFSSLSLSLVESRRLSNNNNNNNNINNKQQRHSSLRLSSFLFYPLPNNDGRGRSCCWPAVGYNCIVVVVVIVVFDDVVKDIFVSSNKIFLVGYYGITIVHSLDETNGNPSSSSSNNNIIVSTVLVNDEQCRRNSSKKIYEQ